MAWLMAVGSGLFRSSTDANRMGSTPLLPYLAAQATRQGRHVKNYAAMLSFVEIRGWHCAGAYVQQTPISLPETDLGSSLRNLPAGRHRTYIYEMV